MIGRPGCQTGECHARNCPSNCLVFSHRNIAHVQSLTLGLSRVEWDVTSFAQIVTRHEATESVRTCLSSLQIMQKTAPPGIFHLLINNLFRVRWQSHMYRNEEDTLAKHLNEERLHDGTVEMGMKPMQEYNLCFYVATIKSNGNVFVDFGPTSMQLGDVLAGSVRGEERGAISLVLRPHGELETSTEGGTTTYRLVGSAYRSGPVCDGMGTVHWNDREADSPVIVNLV